MFQVKSNSLASLYFCCCFGNLLTFLQVENYEFYEGMMVGCFLCPPFNFHSSSHLDLIWISTFSIVCSLARNFLFILNFMTHPFILHKLYHDFHQVYTHRNGTGGNVGVRWRSVDVFMLLSTFNKSQENHVLGGTRGTKAIIE